MIIDNNIAIDSFFNKGNTNINSVKNNTEQSLKYIKDRYKDDELLNEAVRFSDHLFAEAFKSDIESLKRIGFYPSTEAQYELEFAIKQLLSGSYKNSVDHMRRALELTIAALYFSSDNSDCKKAREWMDSKKGIPSFSGTMIKALSQEKRFKEIDELHSWGKDIKTHYWNLCDYIHVKGMSKGYRVLNQGNTSMTCGNSTLPINNDTIDEFIALFIETVRCLLVSLYLYNPILLKGMPIDEKFGYDFPVSGYYNDSQAEMMKKLIPEKYRDFFKNLETSDDEIIETEKSILARPDIIC